jgi:hypothetical protein
MMQTCTIHKGKITPGTEFADVLEDPQAVSLWSLHTKAYFYGLFTMPDGEELTVVEFCVGPDVRADIVDDLPSGFWLLNANDAYVISPEKAMPYSPVSGEAKLPTYHSRQFESISRQLYPSQYCCYAWKFNPWTGRQRSPIAILKDPQCWRGEKGTDQREGADNEEDVRALVAEAPMDYSPLTGERDDAIYKTRFNASTYRVLYPQQVWSYNPWTGKRREPADIKADPRCLMAVHSQTEKELAT